MNQNQNEEELSQFSKEKILMTFKNQKSTKKLQKSLNNFSKEVIDTIINDIDTIDKLKKINKKYKSKYKIKLSLIYSKDYLEKNYLKQIIFTTLKLCSLIIFLIINRLY